MSGDKDQGMRRCPHCDVEIVPKEGAQALLDKASGDWYAHELGDCPECGSTFITGKRWKIDPPRGYEKKVC